MPTGTCTLSNRHDIIDSRDVIARIDELESDLEEYDVADVAKNDEHPFQDDAIELQILRALAEEGESSPDWNHGETLIRDSYFKYYAQDLAEQLGLMTSNQAWPHTCIDWDHAVSELQMDYTCVSYDGVDYWLRS